MALNPHKNMDLKPIWFKKGEYRDLVKALEDVNNDRVLDIIFGIKHRGDLEL